jgi:hypothetical protein
MVPISYRTLLINQPAKKVCLLFGQRLVKYGPVHPSTIKPLLSSHLSTGSGDKRPKPQVRFGFTDKGLWHTLDVLRAGPRLKGGYIPVQLGLMAEVKFFGGYIRDSVVRSVAPRTNSLAFGSDKPAGRAAPVVVAVDAAQCGAG